ncbi:MAG: hypothetical protein AB9836_12180 [Aminipila sp.]
MAKEIRIVCTNIFKNTNKDIIKTEFNKKFVQAIKELERNKSYIGKLK